MVVLELLVRCILACTENTKISYYLNKVELQKCHTYDRQVRWMFAALFVALSICLKVISYIKFTADISLSSHSLLASWQCGNNL